MEARESPREQEFDYARTVALSDGVFAIALTLLVLTISIPMLRTGHAGALGDRLLDRGDEFLSYAISFAVIGLLWIRHHRFFAGVRRVDRTLTVLNLLYLGFVAFLPYPTQILGRYGDEPAAVVLYAATVAIISLLAGAVRVHAVRADLLSPTARGRLIQREHWAITPAVFLLSIPLAFVSTTAALCSWLLLAVATRLQRGGSS
jgi:uncharacterized membrane protein